MKRNIITLLLSIYGLTNTFSQTYDKVYKMKNGFQSVKKDGKWGYLNKEGELVIPLKYDNTFDFSDCGVASVELNGKRGLINSKGGVILPIEQDKISSNKFGRRIVKNGKKNLYSCEGKKLTQMGYVKMSDPWSNGNRVVALIEKRGVIDASGKVVFPLIYDEIYQPQKNQVVVLKKNGRYGLSTINLKSITEINYSKISEYNDKGYAEFKRGLITGYLDAKGNESNVKHPEDKDYEVVNGMTRFRKDGLYGCKNASGKVIIPAIYDVVTNFDENYNLSRARIGAYIGVINKQGKVIIPFQYDVIKEIDKNGMFSVEQNGKIGAIDYTGKVINELSLDPTFATLTKYKSGEKWGFKDEEGNVVIKPQYDNVSDFNKVKGYSDKFYARAIKGGKWGLINKKNETILAFNYDKIWQFENDIAVIKKGDKIGYYKANKGFITKLKFEDGSYFGKGYLAKVSMIKKGRTTYGYINEKGKEVIPPIYDKVRECKNGNILATFFSSNNITTHGSYLLKKNKYTIYNAKGVQDVNLILDDLTYGENDGNKTYGKYWFKINGKSGEISQTSVNQKSLSKIAKITNSEYGLDQYTLYNKNYIYIYNNTVEAKAVHYSEDESANFRSDYHVKTIVIEPGELLITEATKWREVYVSTGSIMHSKKVISKGYKSNCGKVIGIGSYLPDYIDKEETKTYTIK